MNTRRLSFAAAMLAVLALAAETHAGRPRRGDTTDTRRSKTRTATTRTAPRFEGKRSLQRGGRRLPTLIRDAKPTLPAAPSAPSVTPTPRTKLPGTVASNLYKVSAYKYKSSSPKFRVSSVHNADQVTVGGATFRDDAQHFLSLRYKGEAGEHLFLSCTLSMASNATPTFKMSGGTAATTLTLPAGKTVRQLDYSTTTKSTAATLKIQSQTPDQAWTWHGCTLTVK